MSNTISCSRLTVINRRNILFLILALSVLVRIGMAFYFGDNVEVFPGIADQKTYHVLAQRVLNGHGFTFPEPWWPATRAGDPTAHWSFLYTFYLVLIYKLTGVSPIAARLFQAILVGTLHPVIIYMIGERVFDSRVGFVAAVITAFYAYFVYYSAALMTEAFFVTMLLTSLLLVIQLSEANKTEDGTLPFRMWTLTLCLGVILGVAVLLRQLILLIIPIIMLWLGVTLKGRIGIKQTAGIILLVGLIVALFVLPFSLSNYRRFGQFVMLNTNAGFAFFWANHPIHGTQFQPILSGNSMTYYDLIPKELLGLNEAELDRALLKRGFGFVVAEPFRYFLLSISRIPAYFKFWPSTDSSLFSNISRVMSFGVTLPLMVIGVVQSLHIKKNDFRGLGSPLVLLLVFGVAYTGIHILSWALIRYRLPVDAVMIVFAAYAIVNMVTGM